MLAIAILGGSLAVLGEMIRIGGQNALAARDLTTAQLICESKMNEIVAGALPLQDAANQAVENFGQPDSWTYSVQLQQIDQEGLIGLLVTVQKSDNPVRPTTYTLVRWMIDPEAEANAEAAGEDASTSTTGSTSSTGSSSSTGGGTSG